MYAPRSTGLLSAAATAALVLGSVAVVPHAAMAAPAVGIPAVAADGSVPRAGQWVNPLQAETYRYSSPYGPRCIPVIGGSTLHMGQDLALADGSPIYAVADGKVVKARSGTTSTSGYIVIDHNDNGRKIQTVYVHMWSATSHVQVGQMVKAGQQIAKVGNSGPSTAPHLHFEVWDGQWYVQDTIEPIDFMKKKGVDIRAGAYLDYNLRQHTSCTYYANKSTSLKATPYATSTTLRTVSKGSAMTSKPGTMVNGYVPVTTGGVYGWVERYAVSPGQVSLAPVASTVVPVTTDSSVEGTEFTTTSTLNLRSRAVDGSIVKTMAKGDSVTATGKVTTDKKWYEVKHGTTTGWAAAAFLNEVVVEAKPVTRTLDSLRGLPHTVNVNLNLRSEAPDGAVVEVMPEGAEVTATGVVSSDYTWYNVQFGTVSGWVDAAYLNAAPPTRTLAWLEDKAYTTNSPAHLRKEGTATAPAITVLEKDAAMTATGLVTTDSNWYQVKAGSTIGWVELRLMDATPPATKTLSSLAGKPFTTSAAAHLRKEGTATAPAIRVLAKDAAMTATGEVTTDSKWYQVRAGSTIGWIEHRLMEVATPATKTIASLKGKAYTTNAAAHFRKEGTSDAPALRILAKNAAMTATGVVTADSKWYQVKVGSTTGWVEPRLMKATPLPTKTLASLKGKAYTTNAAAHLRKEGTSAAPALRILPRAAALTATGVVSLDSKWYQVKAGTTTGWIEPRLMKATAPALATKTLTSLKAKPLEVASTVYLRDAPVNGKVLKTMRRGSALTATGVVSLDSRWYQVKSGTQTGWSMASYLKAAPPAATTKIAASLKDAPLEVASTVYLRQAPVNGKVLRTMRTGLALTATGVVSLDSKWYQVKSGTQTGWSMASYLKVAPPAPATKIAASLKGAPLAVASTVYLRQAPVNGRVLATMKRGSALTATGVVTTDSRWYQVKSGTQTGWSMASYLKAAPAVPTTKTVASLAGKPYTTAVNLYLRQAPVSGTVLTTMTSGSAVSATGVVSPDSKWYQVKFGTRTGWVMASYLKPKATAPVTVKATTKTTTANVNLRTGASTADAVVVLLKKDQIVTLTGQQSGIWAQVRVGTQTGWVHTDYLR
ncbi:SH3 domain-containing protein [Arthrobacter sp. KK5.5]|uniref:SH3 domain-containing protein n=1 Tax=Arthrobacter sp. KK5.5 TaxID=3373084 RepID=UPI003EE60A68